MKMFKYLAWLWLPVLSTLAAQTQTNTPASVNPYPLHMKDWKIETIVEAPNINNPSVVCCAPDGRIFVGQDLMDMSQPSEKPTDSVLCIHPNGKITLFAT